MKNIIGIGVPISTVPTHGNKPDLRKVGKEIYEVLTGTGSHGYKQRADPRYSGVGSLTGPQTEKRGSAMTPGRSVYSQLLQLFPRRQFAQAVKQHQAEFNSKGFPCRGQFVAMLFCKVAHLNSLREVCMGLAGCEALLWA